jgi:hypothetical protein
MTDLEHIQADARPDAGGQDDVMAEHGSMVSRDHHAHATGA